jgi:hypothetical protein
VIQICPFIRKSFSTINSNYRIEFFELILLNDPVFSQDVFEAILCSSELKIFNETPNFFAEKERRKSLK